MQATLLLKQAYWNAFAAFYSKFTPIEKPIQNKYFGQFVIEFLRGSTPIDRDYSVKNMFRLDVGDRSYSLLIICILALIQGNFFLRHHCSELTLYKRHRSEKIEGKKERKLSLSQFSSILSECFEFLGIKVDPFAANQIFATTDINSTGFITYLQYFSSFQKHLCRYFKSQLFEPQDKKGALKKSRVLDHSWNNLRRLYDSYVQGRVLQATDFELRNFISAIVEDKSESAINFLLINFLKTPNLTIQFQSFGGSLLLLIGELAVSHYALNTDATNRIFTQDKDYFYALMYSFVGITQFEASYNHHFFPVIDYDKNGSITYQEYLLWLRGFFSQRHYYGQHYYTPDDDPDVPHPAPIFKLPTDPSQPRFNSAHFNFSDHSFGVQARKKLYNILATYNLDAEEEFNETEVKSVFTNLLAQTANFEQFFRNALRYDRDGDRSLIYEQFVDFLVQYFSGELVYVKLGKDTLSKQQFGQTFNKAFSVFGIVAPQAVISLLFDEIDLNKDGEIPSITYFLFLKHYLGSWSPARQQTLSYREGKGINPESQKFIASLQGLSPFERFTRIIVDQLKKVFYNYDCDKNLTFESHQIKDILKKVFSLQENDIGYILFNFFNFGASNNGVSFESLIQIILSNYFVEILLKNRYQYQKDSVVWKQKKLNAQQFISLMTDSCFFLKVKPNTQDLAVIFAQIDSGNKGFISFAEYTAFIKMTLSSNKDLMSLESKTNATEISPEEGQLSKALWDRLSLYFKQYDKQQKGSLTQDQLSHFVDQVLYDYSKKQRDFLYWSIFMADQTPNRSVQFSEFASLIINNSAEVTLQQFLYLKPKGTVEVRKDEFVSLVKNSFTFLQNISKEIITIEKSFSRIQINQTVSTYGYLHWVHKTLGVHNA